MKTKKEIIKSTSYWLTNIQIDLFRQIKDFMIKNGLNQNDMAEKLKVSKGHISQILNGDSNFTLKKLINLSISTGKVPILKFINFNKYLIFEKQIEKFFASIENYSDNETKNNVKLEKDFLTLDNRIAEISKPKPQPSEILNYFNYPNPIEISNSTIN